MRCVKTLCIANVGGHSGKLKDQSFVLCNENNCITFNVCRSSDMYLLKNERTLSKKQFKPTNQLCELRN